MLLGLLLTVWHREDADAQGLLYPKGKREKGELKVTPAERWHSISADAAESLGADLFLAARTGMRSFIKEGLMAEDDSGAVLLQGAPPHITCKLHVAFSFLFSFSSKYLRI